MFRLTDFISKEDLASFCVKNHIKKLALYGSALRGGLRSDSDIDLLVEFEKKNTPGLLDISGMELELSETIGRKVDLRTPQDLSHYFRHKVIAEAVVEYAG